MAFTWIAAAPSIAGLDRRTHYRFGNPGQRPMAGPVPVLCGRVISPSALVTPPAEDCPDCATLRRNTAGWRRPYDLRGPARWRPSRTVETAQPR